MDDADSSKPSARVVGRPFAPGQSGNPGGKNPEKEELRRYIRTFSKENVDGVMELARNAQNEKVRLSARTWMLEQDIGKALIAISGEDGGPLKLDMDLLNKLERLAGERK